MNGIDTSSLDVRIDFLSAVMSGVQKTPITGHEMKIVQSKSILRDIDLVLKDKSTFYGIMDVATKVKGLSSIKDILFLLLDCHDMDELDVAIEIIEAMVSENKSMTTDDLFKAVQENASGLPPMLFIAISGKEKKEEKVYEMPSGLNLDAMKNFLDGF